MNGRIIRRGKVATTGRTIGAAQKLLPLPFGKGEGRGEGLPLRPTVILAIANRQRTRTLDLRLLRRIIDALLKDHIRIANAELGITLVAAPEMTRLNEAFLQHQGSTDVITFDYAATALPRPQTPDPRADIRGELFVCVDEAMLQARRFRTTWQSEVIRYLVHGVLHLLGHDDHRAADRRRMKREENRLVRLLVARFPLSQLARKTNPRR